MQTNTNGTHEAKVDALTQETFRARVEKARGLALVEFTAVWCGPCRAMTPVVHAVANENVGRVLVATVDADNEPEIAAAYNVRGMPTTVMFRDGKEIGRVLGALSKRALDARMAEWQSNG